MKKSDVALHLAVTRAFECDPRMSADHVSVAVDDGIVTLGGTVDSWVKRIMAQEAAHDVPGVLDVANEIEVKLPPSSERTDTEVAHAVREVLRWDVLVPDERIRSTVTNGWVMLEGEVATHTQRGDVERAVRNLTGVCGISNRLEVVQAS